MLSCFSMRAFLFVCIIFTTLWVSIASADTSLINQLVQQLVSTNPAIESARAAVKAAEARLINAGLPLNNPVFGIDAERTDVNTYSIGISQTIDWHDKQNSLQSAARINLALAQAQLANIKLSKTSELLKTIGNIAAYHEITSLSKRRVETLQRFSDLAEKRYQIGDIPQTEMQLARLSLTESVMQHAGESAKFIQAKTDLFNLNGQLLKKNPQFLQLLPSRLNNDLDVESQAQNHPLVQISYQKSLLAKQQIKVVDQGRKADPTIGLMAGKDGDDNLIGLSFSIPLQHRNNYQSQVVEAKAEALKVEYEAQQVYRIVLGTLQGHREQYDLMAKAWSIWVSQGRSSLQQRNELLEKQWQAGEMSTTDYLIQLQQTIDTQITGVELHNNLWQSWINWLSSTNTLEKWLREMNKGEK